MQRFGIVRFTPGFSGKFREIPLQCLISHLFNSFYNFSIGHILLQKPHNNALNDVVSFSPNHDDRQHTAVHMN